MTLSERVTDIRQDFHNGQLKWPRNPAGGEVKRVCTEDRGTDPQAEGRPWESFVVRVLWGLVSQVLADDLGAIEGEVRLPNAALLPVQLC